MLRRNFATFCMIAALAAQAGCGSDDTPPLQVGTSADGTSNGADGGLSGDAASADSQGGSDTLADTTQAGSDAVPDSAADSAASDVSAKYPLCSELVTCVAVACGGTWTPGCAKPCLDGGSSDAKAQLQPYLDCVDTYCTKGVCAGNSTAGCMDKCAGDKCFAKMIACGANGASGNAGCSSAFGCLEGCKNKGLACYFDCYGGMSKAAQAQFEALTSCALAAGGADPFSQCPVQSLTCMADGKTGSGDCKSMLLCTAECEAAGKNDNGTCIGGCWAGGTADAQGQWLTVLACDSTPTAGCSDAFGKCIPSSGSKTCLDTLSCWSKCGTSKTCPFDCIASASPAEGKKVADLIFCQNANCKYCAGDSTCEDTCRKTKCSGPWTACLAP